FFFIDSPTAEIYTLSLHDALPIWFFSPFVHVVTAASVTAVPAAGVKRKRKDLAGAVSSKVSTLTPSFETLSGFGPHLPITRQTPSPFTSSSKTAGPVAFHESTARSKGSAS